MGVVATPGETHSIFRDASRVGALVFCCTYAMVVGVTVARHEPWADEAQSWLLARDGSLIDLWTRLLHYEGTPGLWQTVLHVLQRFSLPYAGMNIVSGLLGLAGTVLITLYAPFPRGIRWALPFTYYLVYQYPVVARSYALLPALIFGCAILFEDAEGRIWLFTALLCLMASVSIHGLALSVSIWVGAHLRIPSKWASLPSSRRIRLLFADGCYGTVLLILIASAWPAKDVTFVRHLNFSAAHLFATSGATFAEAFTGGWISSLVLVALSVPFLRRNRGLPVFLLAAAMLCLVNGIVYSQVWHRALLLPAWLFAMWISAQSAKLDWAAASALVALLAIQGYWTAAAVAYDWQYPYSGAKEAAEFIHENHLEATSLYAIGYACTAVQPYFPVNIFSNLNMGGKAAYWDWSSRNHSLEDVDRLDKLHPDYVLVGYTGVAEKMIWTKEVRRSGYRPVRHFEGNLFWRDGVLEPDAFDLYRRP